MKQRRSLHLNFNIFRQPSTWTYNENKVYKTLDGGFREMFNFDFGFVWLICLITWRFSLNVVPRPNLDEYVFVRINEKEGQVLVDPE